MGESRIIPTLHESGVHGWTWGQAVCDFWYSENEVIPKSDGLAIQPEVVTNYNVTGSKQQAASNKLLDNVSRII